MESGFSSGKRWSSADKEPVAGPRTWSFSWRSLILESQNPFKHDTKKETLDFSSLRPQVESGQTEESSSAFPRIERIAELAGPSVLAARKVTDRSNYPDCFLTHRPILRDSDTQWLPRKIHRARIGMANAGRRIGSAMTYNKAARVLKPDAEFFGISKNH